MLQKCKFSTIINTSTHGLRLMDRKLASASFFLGKKRGLMARVKVYIDGFNLYHAIAELGRKKRHLKWLNLWGLSNSLLKEHEELSGVEYFSALKKTSIDRLKRHEQYIEALKYYNVTIHLGKFKKKNHYCKVCNQQYTGWEEKETDVHIAVKIVEDAFTDQFDKAIIISADTDLLPPINSVKSFFQEKDIVVVAPPKRMSRCRSMNPIYEIPVSKLNQNLLPKTANDKNGKPAFSRPDDYELHK